MQQRCAILQSKQEKKINKDLLTQHHFFRSYTNIDPTTTKKLRKQNQRFSTIEYFFLSTVEMLTCKKEMRKKKYN